ncbi:hypothetical protein R1flu_005438 [Riccia fluitans]|uniref:Uncharacterized protein n=1 Tax=Riccia fluitans TaxID=41844 RepID=A0ABD1YU50_9MARC
MGLPALFTLNAHAYSITEPGRTLSTNPNERNGLYLGVKIHSQTGLEKLLVGSLPHTLAFNFHSASTADQRGADGGSTGCGSAAALSGWTGTSIIALMLIETRREGARAVHKDTSSVHSGNGCDFGAEHNLPPVECGELVGHLG